MIKNSKLAKLLKVEGIVLYPFILFASARPSPTLVRHELIHIQQIKRLGVLRFYFLYFKEYFQLRLKGHNHHQAYRSISFEKEAYEKQHTS